MQVKWRDRLPEHTVYYKNGKTGMGRLLRATGLGCWADKGRGLFLEKHEGPLSSGGDGVIRVSARAVVWSFKAIIR